MKNERKDLLNTILDLMEYSYLSDLRFQMVDTKTLNKIKEDEFSIQEWNEAIRYITNTEGNCSSVQEAKLYLEKESKLKK